MTSRILLLLAALCITSLCHASQQSDLCDRYRLTAKECDYVHITPAGLESAEDIRQYREELARLIAEQNNAEIDRFLDSPPKRGGAGRAAFATLLAAAIGMVVGVFVSRRIGANATEKGAKDTAIRWMGFGVTIGIIRFFVAGLSPIFSGVAGSGKGFAEGVVLIIIYAPIGYILGYIVGKFRGEKEQENGQDWAGDLHVAKPEPQGGDALASEGKSLTQPLTNPKPETNLAISDGAIYERIANELETGNTDKATWTKAFALADGDDKQARAKYIKLRFAALSSPA